MKVSYDLLNTCAVETPGAALPADESERLAALGELDLVDHDDPALESLCNLLTNLFKVPLAGACPPPITSPSCAFRQTHIAILNCSTPTRLGARRRA